MKKFWKVKVDSNYKKSLIDLGIIDWYINVLTSKHCSPMEYIIESKSKYIFICYDSNYGTYNKFGWEKIENIKYMQENYDFCGIIDIRKAKLKKLNELYKSAI